MRLTKVHQAGLLSTLFLLPLAVSAQTNLPGSYRDSLGVPFNNPISASISTMIWGNINRAAMAGSQRRGSAPGNASAPARRNGVGSSRTAAQPDTGEVIPSSRKHPAVQFKPTGTRLVLDEYLRAINVGPEQKTELRELIPAIWTVYEEEAALKGYPNDVALAFVSFIGLNAHIYAGRTEKLEFSFAQNVGLRDVVADRVTSNGTFTNFTDKQKQELYELFTLLGGLTFQYYLKAVKENNGQDLKELRVVAAENLKLVGIEP